MAKNKITEYDSTAANNTDVGGVNLAENSMLPSDVNNALREILSHLKDFADGTSGINVLSLIDDDDSHAIKFQGPSSITANTTFTLPDGDGSADQYLKTDGSGTLAWVSPSSFSLPAGLVFPYAGATAPTGYLLCYGQTLGNASSGATEANDNYQALFDVIKTAYGNSGSEVFGDGDTVTLPDLRGRVAAGKDDMGGSAASRITSSQSNSDDPITGATLGDTGGDEVQALQITHLPSHSHGAGTYQSSFTRLNSSSGSGFQGILRADGTGGSNQVTQTNTVSGTSGSTGSGTAVNNMQPTIILNYIISTGS